MRETIFVALTFVSMFVACSNTTSTNGNDPVDIKNVWWRLEWFEAVTGDTITLAPDESYLAFFADTLWGKTDSLCRNTYYAAYWVGNHDSLSIGPINTTKVGCRSSYAEYLLALGNATSFQIIDNELIVFHSGGTKKLSFVKQ